MSLSFQLAPSFILNHDGVTLSVHESSFVCTSFGIFSGCFALYHLRTFLNSDPPKIAELWSSQSPHRAIAQTVSTSVLEQLIFAKPYFDPESFFVVEDNRDIVGFIHPILANSFYESLEEKTAIITMVMVSNHAPVEETLDRLMDAVLSKMAEQQVTKIHFAGLLPFGPFYFGLYGGSRNIGIRSSHQKLIEWFTRFEFSWTEIGSIYARSLANFRPAVSRDMMMIRRKFAVMPVYDPPENNWFESCLFIQQQKIRFELIEKATSEVVGQATFVSLEKFSISWGVHAYGLWNISVSNDSATESHMNYLLGEAFRQLHEVDATWIEVFVEKEDLQLQSVLQSMDFNQEDIVLDASKSI